MKGNVLGAIFLVVLAGAIFWVIRTNLRPEPAAAGSSGQPVLMDFYADWCGPCQMMKPTVHELAAELEGQLQVVEVNVDRNPELAQKFNVRSIPYFVVLRDGREVARKTGSMPKESLRRMTGL